MARSTTARTDKKGFSLAKGPIGLIGLAMLAWGVISFLMGGDSFTANPPDGIVTGDTFLGVESNGWTNLLWAGGGLLLLLSAPMHWGAKTMGILVGLVLVAAAIISLVDGPEVFGIFAANGMTQLLWGAVGAALLLFAMLPRVGRRKRHDHAEAERGPVVERGRERRHVEPLEREAYERGRRDAERELTHERDRSSRFDREPVADRDPDHHDHRTTVAPAGEEPADRDRDRGGFRRL